VSQEVFLDGSHRDLTRRDLGGEAVGLARKLGMAESAFLKEPEKKSARLIGSGVPQLDLPIDPTRAQKRRIKPLGVIGGQE